MPLIKFIAIADDHAPSEKAIKAAAYVNNEGNIKSKQLADLDPQTGESVVVQEDVTPSSVAEALGKLSLLAAKQKQEELIAQRKKRSKSFHGKVQSLLGNKAPPVPAIDALREQILRDQQVSHFDTGLGGINLYASDLSMSDAAAMNYVLIELLKSRAIRITAPTKESNYMTVNYSKPGSLDGTEVVKVSVVDKKSEVFKSVEELLIALLELHAAKITIPKDDSRVKLLGLQYSCTGQEMKKQLLTLITKLKEVKAATLQGSLRRKVDVSEVHLGPAIDELERKLKSEVVENPFDTFGDARSGTPEMLFSTQQQQEVAHQQTESEEFSNNEYVISGWEADYSTQTSLQDATYLSIYFHGEDNQYWIKDKSADNNVVTFICDDEGNERTVVAGLGIIDSYPDEGQGAQRFLLLPDNNQYLIVEESTDIKEGVVTYKVSDNETVTARQDIDSPATWNKSKPGSGLGMQ
jgi:hypothetical protein